MKIKWISLLAVLCLLFSCKDDDPATGSRPDVPEDSPEYYFINRFIADCQQTYYLWNDQIDTGLDIRTHSDPFNYFKEMVYTADKWSTLTDDIKALSNSFAGVETTYDYSLQFWRFGDTTDQVFAVVEFVYSGSPADKAGLQRGDVIFQINGKEMNSSNYTDLYYSSSVTIGLGVYDPEYYIIKDLE
ncbi:MAG: PDZ domain-containing protein [Bacteroides sp.]|nr:PDZ domain-containing protein [Bacteroides sp.]